MRLISVDTYELKEFFDGGVPTYAILSHTWGDGEVKFQEFQNITEAVRSKPGFSKIRFACQRAKLDGYEWCWADTCCIDKTSSAELSEAINSMFRWYQSSAACYVYLVDVPSLEEDDIYAPNSAFRRSRWFTRGWTLQELLAPHHVHFFSRDWTYIGPKWSPKSMQQFPGKNDTPEDLGQLLSSITRIPKWLLWSSDTIFEYSVAQRMSWASTRTCTRVEDTAYSLMGIFGINMPLLYGEGRRAFIRLQDEIIRNSDDHTLFAWIQQGPLSPWGRTIMSPILATSPDSFALSTDVRRTGHEVGELSAMTKYGLRIDLVRSKLHPTIHPEIIPVAGQDNYLFLAVLNSTLSELIPHRYPLLGTGLRLALLLQSDGSRWNKRIGTGYHIAVATEGLALEDTDNFTLIYVQQAFQDPRTAEVLDVDTDPRHQFNGFAWKGVPFATTQPFIATTVASDDILTFRGGFMAEFQSYTPPNKIRWSRPGNFEISAVLSATDTLYLCDDSSIQLIANLGLTTVFFLHETSRRKEDDKPLPRLRFGMVFGYKQLKYEEGFMCSHRSFIFFKLFPFSPDGRHDPEDPHTWVPMLKESWSNFRPTVNLLPWTSLPLHGPEAFHALDINGRTVVVGFKALMYPKFPGFPLRQLYEARIGEVPAGS